MRADYNANDYQNDETFLEGVNAEDRELLLAENNVEIGTHQTRVQLLREKGMQNLFARGGRRISLETLEEEALEEDRWRVLRAFGRTYRQAERNIADYDEAQANPPQPEPITQDVDGLQNQLLPLMREMRGVLDNLKASEKTPLFYDIPGLRTQEQDLDGRIREITAECEPRTLEELRSRILVFDVSCRYL